MYLLRAEDSLHTKLLLHKPSLVESVNFTSRNENPKIYSDVKKKNCYSNANNNSF